jgi:hypothetical protein
MYIVYKYSICTLYSSVSPGVCEGVGILLCGQKMDGQNLLRSEEGGPSPPSGIRPPGHKNSQIGNSPPGKTLSDNKNNERKNLHLLEGHVTVASLREISLENSSVLKRMIQSNLTTKAELVHYINLIQNDVSSYIKYPVVLLLTTTETKTVQSQLLFMNNMM